MGGLHTYLGKKLILIRFGISFFLAFIGLGRVFQKFALPLGNLIGMDLEPFGHFGQGLPFL